MRKFQLDQSILETVVRFDVADTAPKRRIGPTAQSPAYGTPHFFFALRRVSLGLVCFFRSHLSSHEPHITRVREVVRNLGADQTQQVRREHPGRGLRAKEKRRPS